MSETTRNAAQEWYKENGSGASETSPLVDQIKFVRVAIDGLMANAEANKRSAETTLAWRSLQMGKSWLGKALGELKQPNPYPASNTAKDIPPTADTAKEATIIIGKDDNAWTQYLNEQRLKLDGVIGSPVFYSYHSFEMHSSGADVTKYTLALQNSSRHLAEAKFWLGFELGIVRERNQ